jgi:hypothetical protein
LQEGILFFDVGRWPAWQSWQVIVLCFAPFASISAGWLAWHFTQSLELSDSAAAARDDTAENSMITHDRFNKSRTQVFVSMFPPER